MHRLQRFVAQITLAEKEERERRKKVQKLILGYNPDLWKITDIRIRNYVEDDCNFQPIHLPNPLQGKHKFSNCNGLYLSIHAFINQRLWAPADEQSTTAGMSWLELFCLFDTTYARRHDAVHARDVEAKKRAVSRKNAKAKRLGSSGNRTDDIVILPSLVEEMRLFQRIFHHIARHDMPAKESQWFQADTRVHLRRLANLGITGHHPCMKAHVAMHNEEKEHVLLCLIMQKAGMNSKIFQEIKAFKNRQSQVQDDQELSMKIKLQKVAFTTPVKWRRTVATENQNHHEGEQAPEYRSRILRCTKCDHGQETCGTKLHSMTGFKDIYCLRCGKQERCIRNRCQCDVVWHQCLVHRIDPHTATPSLRKTTVNKKDYARDTRNGTAAITLTSTRPAPLFPTKVPKKGPSTSCFYPPAENFIRRIRLKQTRSCDAYDQIGETAITIDNYGHADDQMDVMMGNYGDADDQMDVKIGNYGDADDQTDPKGIFLWTT